MIGRFSAIILSGFYLASAASPVCRSWAEEQSESEQIQFFEKHIRPVLVNECYSCHSDKGEEIEGGLTLDTREGIRKGGDTGSAVVPGDVRRSVLIKAIRYADDDLRI